MDPTSTRIVVGETGFVPEGAGTPTLQSTWVFHVCTNSWREIGDSSLPAPELRPGLSQLVTDQEARVVRGIPFRWTPVWTLDPASGTWTATTASPSGRQAVPKAAYDTDGDRLLAFDPIPAAPGASGVAAYDPAAGTWTPLQLADPELQMPAISPSLTHDLAYDSAAHRLVLVLTPVSPGASAATWVFDPAARRWAGGAPVPDTLAAGYPSSGWAAGFDPATERTWWFADTAMLGYDARADTWQVAERGPGWPEPEVLLGVEVDPVARIVSTMVPDPINGRLVLIGGEVRPVGEPAGGFIEQGAPMTTDDVWAYRPATNTWTMLLDASGEPASYGPG